MGLDTVILLHLGMFSVTGLLLIAAVNERRRSHRLLNELIARGSHGKGRRLG